VWAHASTTFDKIKGSAPLTVDEGGFRNKFTKTEYAKVMEQNREVSGFPGLITHVPPQQSSGMDADDDPEVIKKIALKHFFDSNGRPCAPKAWPSKLSLPVVVKSLEVMPIVGQYKLLGYHAMVKAFWYAVAEVSKMLSAKYEAETIDLMTSFVNLGRNIKFEIFFLPTEEDENVKIAQLFEDAEELREYFGFSGFRKCLMTGRFYRTLKKNNNNVDPSMQELADYMNQKIRWTSERTLKKQTVGTWLKLDKKFQENPAFAQAVKAAQALGGRATVFDEPSKLTEMVNKASDKAELGWIAEWMLSLIKKADGDKSKMEFDSKGLSKAWGEFGISAWSRKVVQYILKASACRDTQDLFTYFSSPRKWDERDTGKVVSMSLFAKSVYEFASEFMEREHYSLLAGLIREPPTGGLTVEYILSRPSLKDKWDKVLKKKEELHGEGDVEGKADKQDGPDGQAQVSDGPDEFGCVVDSWTRICEDARKRAEKAVKLRAICVAPERKSGEAIRLVVDSQELSKCNGRFGCIFDAKCDEEARVTSTMHKREARRSPPAISTDRVRNFIAGMTPLMKEGNDFMIILCGSGAAARHAVEKCVDAAGLKTRELFLFYDPAMKAEFVGGRRRSFGCGNASEMCFICWKGETPAVAVKSHKFVDVGASCHWDHIRNVPIATADDLVKIDSARKEQILADSSWTHKPAEETSSSDDSDEVGESPSKKRKYTKRGKKLLRRHSGEEVDAFNHPTPELLVKELVHMLELQWVCFGTPGDFSGSRACMDMDLPSIAIARNAVHAAWGDEVLVDYVADQILSLGTQFTFMPLVLRAQAVDKKKEGEDDGQKDDDKEKEKKNDKERSKKDGASKEKGKKDDKEKGKKDDKSKEKEKEKNKKEDKEKINDKEKDRDRKKEKDKDMGRR